MSVQELLINSVDEMHAFASDIARTLKGGEVIALIGELGAGKTTFTQGLAKALGIVSTISSPTFALERQYQAHNGLTLHHYDWYRLDDEEAVKNLGVEEVMGEPDTIVVVEWPERANALLPSDTISIRIDYVTEQTRKITINH